MATSTLPFAPVAQDLTPAAPSNKLPKSFIAFAAAYGVATMADVATTMYALTTFDAASEANPVMESLMQSLTLPGAMAVKVLLAAFVVLSLAIRYRQKSVLTFRLLNRLGIKTRGESKIISARRRFAQIVMALAALLTFAVVGNNIAVVAMASIPAMASATVFIAAAALATLSIIAIGVLTIMRRITPAAACTLVLCAATFLKIAATTSIFWN